MTVTLRDMIAEAARELKMRENVYPRMVAHGRLKQYDADNQIERLRAILENLMAQEPDAGEQQQLFGGVA